MGCVCARNKIPLGYRQAAYTQNRGLILSKQTGFCLAAGTFCNSRHAHYVRHKDKWVDFNSLGESGVRLLDTCRF